MEKDPSFKLVIDKLEKDGNLYKIFDSLIVYIMNKYNESDMNSFDKYYEYDIKTLSYEKKEQFAKYFYLDPYENNFTERLLRILENLDLLIHHDEKELRESTKFLLIEDSYSNIYQEENMDNTDITEFLSHEDSYVYNEENMYNEENIYQQENMDYSDVYIKEKANRLYHVTKPFDGFTWYDMKIAMDIHEDFKLDDLSIRFTNEVHKFWDSNIYLNLENVGIENISYISEGLKINETLGGLNISLNRLNSDEIYFISEALKTNNTLKNLELKFDATASGEEGDEVAEYLSEALKINNTLKKLDLSNYGIGNKGVEYLAKALENNNSLTSLDISNNNINVEGFIKFVNPPLFNNTFSTLIIFDNPMHDKEFQYIKKMLKNSNNINVRITK